MPTTLRILLIAAAAYLALVAFLWLIQGRLIHLPEVPSRTLEGTPADVGLAGVTGVSGKASLRGLRF